MRQYSILENVVSLVLHILLYYERFESNRHSDQQYHTVLANQKLSFCPILKCLKKMRMVGD